MALICLIAALFCFLIATFFQPAIFDGNVLLIPLGLSFLTLAFIIGQPLVADRIGRRG